MKIYYICDRRNKQERCTRTGCNTLCRHTKDRAHQMHRNKKERYFVIYPDIRALVEYETLREMQEEAELVKAEYNGHAAYYVPQCPAQR